MNVAKLETSAHLNQILGKTCSFKRFLNAFSDERSLRRGFENDRVSGEKGGNESVDLDHVWKLIGLSAFEELTMLKRDEGSRRTRELHSKIRSDRSVSHIL